MDSTIGDWFCAFTCYDFWRLDSSLSYTSDAQPEWTLPLRLQTVARCYSGWPNTHIVTHYTATNSPRLALLMHDDEDSLLFLRRLKIRRRKDAPNSRWHFFDYWYYESCDLENDGPFLAALPKSGENEYMFLLSTMDGDVEYKVITLPMQRTERPPVMCDFRKSQELKDWLENGVTPHPELNVPVNENMGGHTALFSWGWG
ncbi:hypothetical protein FN846DRAFT_1021749 [Sphaerosporella brunnea]|uniref:Uncharacterized protein n=1 Tax=Sphaerosporella brunnea TaxID=1250544 RepID=A0A5J5EWP1_9PEZI|nr:hypothetical protein FN846DRAFT_1021749 [Sphaerosporella brunnea]